MGGGFRSVVGGQSLEKARRVMSTITDDDRDFHEAMALLRSARRQSRIAKIAMWAALAICWFVIAGRFFTSS
jgi:hypothetical protein